MMLVLVLAVLVWICMDSQKAECKVIFKIRSQNKGKGKVQTKRAAPSYFIWRKKFVTIKVLHGRENVMGIKENVMRKMKCRKIPIRFRMEPY